MTKFAIVDVGGFVTGEWRGGKLVITDAMRFCTICQRAFRANDPGGTCTVPPDNTYGHIPGHYSACSECCAACGCPAEDVLRGIRHFSDPGRLARSIFNRWVAGGGGYDGGWDGAEENGLYVSINDEVLARAKE